MIDSCVFHEWPGTTTLAGYMTSGWQEVLLRPGDRSGPVRINSHWRYVDPRGAKAASAFPKQGPPGSDFELMRSQVLELDDRERVVLGYDDGLSSTVFANFYVAREVARAANEWTAVEWLPRDDRLYGMVMISAALPEAAAAEIRRAGANQRMVAVALGCNALGRPFGHPIYHPIYEAAAEMSLPVVLQVGCDSSLDQITAPVAGGLPATFGEYRAMSAHPLMSHATSLIVHGVFDLYPDLKLLLVGGGVSWVPGFLWRLDGWYQHMQIEAPWLRRLPSEYFMEHVRLATYSIETAVPSRQLHQALNSIPDFSRLLLYASCYPNADSQRPAEVAARLPASWTDAVFEGNALEFFRWPQVPRGRSRPSSDRLVQVGDLTGGEVTGGNV